MNGVERFGVSMNERLLKQFDQCIQRKGYQSRSEAIRDIVRDYLVASEWESREGEVVGTVTIVYDHHTRELNRVLTDLQHRHHKSIVCTTHVHLDAHNCLEVIVVKGTSQAVRAIADRLIGTRGVKHGKLVCTTTGRTLV